MFVYSVIWREDIFSQPDICFDPKKCQKTKMEVVGTLEMLSGKHCRIVSINGNEHSFLGESLTKN
jgi:hypothetical protein